MLFQLRNEDGLQRRCNSKPSTCLCVIWSGSCGLLLLLSPSPSSGTAFLFAAGSSPQHRGSRHLMRLMGDTSQISVLVLREGVHVNCQCHICHSTAVIDQAQSYKRLRIGSPYMDWFSNLYHHSFCQTVLIPCHNVPLKAGKHFL